MDWLKNSFEPELLEEISGCREQTFDPEVELLSEGSYINQVPLLLSGSVKADAILEAESSMILLGADKVREWMVLYKNWRAFVQSLYYQRLDVLLGLVDAIAFKQVDERLLDKLRELTQIHGEKIPVTHQQIATEIGTAREVISRLLKQLENQGKIQLERGNIRVTDSP